MDMLRGGWGPGMMGNGLVIASGPDVTAPTAITFTPADNATFVSLTANLVVLLSEDVVLGTGNITLKRTSDNVTIEAWDVATEAGTGAGQVNIAGGRLLTMRLTSALAVSTEHYVIWDAGVVKDAANNSVAANASTTLWSFTTGTGASYAAESEAIFAAFTTPPTTGRKDLIDAAVVALKTAGVWDKHDCIYVLAAADSQAATINWKSPGTFNLTVVNSPTFTADRGFTGAATKYLDSTWDPATNGVTYLRDSASLHVWNLTESRANSQHVIGFSPSGAAINPWNSSLDNMSHSLNDAGTNSLNVGGPAIGFYSLSRTASTGHDVYKNGSSLGTHVQASLAVVSSDFHILDSTQYITTKQIAAGAWGGGLTGIEVTDLYNALRTYMTGVGVP